MSGLSNICGYGSDSEDSDCEVLQNFIRKKLPVPDLTKVRVVCTDSHIDDPQLHGCRKRSFPHVRGNWATFVYLKCPADSDILQLINEIKETVSNACDPWDVCEDLHISLSKTVVLNYHCILPFHTSLKKELAGIERFVLEFGAVKVLCNEENSRTFIVLEVEQSNYKNLLTAITKVDQVLSDFNLQTFYEEPSFHVSILWINGNKKLEVVSRLKDLNRILSEFLNSVKSISIDKIYCKSGNKHFQYSLK